MRTESTEIYSDTTNYAVIRHPGRRFPGALIQGDTLYSLCQMADEACAEIQAKNYKEAQAEMNALRNALWERLNHYKNVLGEHEIDLPFSEIP